MDYRNEKNFFYILAVLYTIACWSNINSGYWGLTSWTKGISGFAYALRSTMPLILIGIGLLCFFVQDKRLRGAFNPVWWLSIYGLVALGSGVFSPNPWVASYWAVAFLSVVYLPSFFSLVHYNNDSYPENMMLYTTWIILGIYVIAIYLFFGNDIVVEREILVKTKGTATSIRSSGLARFYGVFAIILITWLFQSAKKKYLLLLVPIFFCLTVVWRAQSRGAIFALFGGIATLVFATRLKWIFTLVLIIILGVSFFMFNYASRAFENNVINHIERGQSRAEFRSMTGRTRAYKKAWTQFKKNPILGCGHWSDRMIIKEHVHNSYLYALLATGIIGFIPYVLSWVSAIYLIIYIFCRLKELSERQQLLFLQCAGVTVFFFIRSIPEVTSATLAVDQLVLVVIFYFLTITYLRLKEKDRCLKVQEKLIL